LPRFKDLDSLAYQKNNQGGKLHVALKAKTELSTTPQLFVVDWLIDGRTETFDVFNNGELHKLLKSSNVTFDESKLLDAYSLLRKWLQPR
jgi:cysteine synthase A